MIRLPVFCLILLLTFSSVLNAQRRKPVSEIPEDYCISDTELQLYRLINEYRVIHGLEIIPLSRSLSYVAHMHVIDLHTNRPDLFGCGLHSWSNKGNWSACCYAEDPNRLNCMWSKPRELTSYMGDGHEMILWENIQPSPRSVLEQWRNLEPTNDMLLNRNRWSGRTWKAMGVGIYEGYVSLWFGEVEDREATIKVCGTKTVFSQNFLIEELNRPTQPVTPPHVERYHLIVGSFNNLKQAEAEVSRLVRGGYTGANVIEIKGNFRVSLQSFDNLAEAQALRRQIASQFKGIWILEH
ncbi:MAG TPA: SPOR domain-containing protein [Bacteroidales bacterium]|nr:SPOR domain-containing protein [Bacteroidales bacterium]